MSNFSIHFRPTEAKCPVLVSILVTTYLRGLCGDLFVDLWYAIRGGSGRGCRMWCLGGLWSCAVLCSIFCLSISYPCFYFLAQYSALLRSRIFKSACLLLRAGNMRKGIYIYTCLKARELTGKTRKRWEQQTPGHNTAPPEESTSRTANKSAPECFPTANDSVATHKTGTLLTSSSPIRMNKVLNMFVMRMHCTRISSKKVLKYAGFTE